MSDVILTGAEAKEVLKEWLSNASAQEQQELHTRWKDLLDSDVHDDLDDFAIYINACPHPNCGVSVLIGFGGSGDSSDHTLAICQNKHVSYFGPSGDFRLEQDIDNDCWTHRHNGPDPCPECQEEDETIE
jgi:hypothetical protein